MLTQPTGKSPEWIWHFEEKMRQAKAKHEQDMKLADEAEKQQKEQLRQKRIEATAKVKAWFEKHEKGSKKDRKKNRRKQC